MADPRNFVLGWDNREKRLRLGEAVRGSQEALGRLDQYLARLEQQLKTLRERQIAAGRALEATDFGALDHAFHDNEIKSLRWEQQQLEEKNEAVRPLKNRLAAAESRHKSLQASRDDVIGTIRDLERDLQSGERLMEAAERQIRVWKADGTFALHTESFETLEEYFAEDPLAAPTLIEREQAFIKARNAEIDTIRPEIEPLKSELGTLMNRFLREFPDERADLEGDVRYLGDFLNLLEHIRREDLPRHEQRFKERLNEKVTQEVGLFNGALQTDCREIVDKIDVLNASLRQVEYRPGTYMRLEPLAVRDPAIVDFQDSLKQCLAGTFEGTLEADEARYLQIEKLLSRLRDEHGWREKVTDVRRWFDFAARELDLATEVERGYYEDSTGQSGGEKAKLAFTILVAAIAYQYDITPGRAVSDRFHFVVVDEMFSKVDDQFSEYALNLFRKFGLQLLIVAPLDAKARVTEPYVGCYLHVVKDVQTNTSEIFSMTAREFEETLDEGRPTGNSRAAAISRRLPR